MVGAIYHRLITTTRKGPDVGDGQDYGQYVGNVYYLQIQMAILVSISATICRF